MNHKSGQRLAMLIPITRPKFEQLVPLTATGPQYKYCWGKFSDFLRRLLFSVVGAAIALVLNSLLAGKGLGALTLVVGTAAGFYWLWGPVFWATLKNIESRKYVYSGFWQGRVMDVFVTEELIGKEETVNKRGELVIVENRERRLNLEVGDETGFSTRLQVPLKRGHQAIVRGQPAEMLLMSYQADLGRVAKTSDIYIPSQNIWVSDYPYLQRDTFIEVSRQLRSQNSERKSDSRRSNSRKSARRRREAMDRE